MDQRRRGYLPYLGCLALLVAASACADSAAGPRPPVLGDYDLVSVADVPMPAKVILVDGQYTYVSGAMRLSRDSTYEVQLVLVLPGGSVAPIDWRGRYHWIAATSQLELDNADPVRLLAGTVSGDTARLVEYRYDPTVPGPEDVFVRRSR